MAKSRKIAIKGSEAPPVPGSRKVGTLDPNERIEVVVHLRYNPESKGLPSMKELAALPLHDQKHLTYEDFEKTYGAFDEDIEKVKVFADEHNLDVEEVNKEQRLMTLKGTLKDFSSAFDVQFHNHKHPFHGTVFRTYEGVVKIPKQLSRIVEGVFGLENIPAFSPHVYHYHKQEPSPYDPSVKQFYPNEIAQLYNFPKDLTGEDQSIALIQLGGGYDTENLQVYFKTLKEKFNIDIDTENITDVLVAGGENAPYYGPVTNMEEFCKYIGTLEVYGDIEVAAAVANKAKIVVYFAPNGYKEFFQAIKQAVHDKNYNHCAISISWGFGEPTKKKPGCLCSILLKIKQLIKKKNGPLHFIKAINHTLHEAACKGITVFVASGDLGSSNQLNMPGVSQSDGYAHVDFPASSPWAVACGGTRIFVENNKIRKEIVWKHHFDEYVIDEFVLEDFTRSSGGGVSDIFPCPVYQVKTAACQKSVNPGHKTGRGMPDVAGTSDIRSGYILYTNEVTITAGTSLVAPLYAALIAQITQKLKKRVGFLNDFLYQIGKSQSIPGIKEKDAVFNNITEGDNATACKKFPDNGCLLEHNRGYYAQKGKGWDACTGWGSINGENLLTALQNRKKS